VDILKERDNFGDLNIDERTILNNILIKESVSMWNRFIRQSTGFTGRPGPYEDEINTTN
jgi:hypothetical protein